MRMSAEARGGAPRTFRAFEVDDTLACMALFDANCPGSFAPNERDAYQAFLASLSGGTDDYEVCLEGQALVGAFGLTHRDVSHSTSLRWIVIAPGAQGRGLGRELMARALAGARRRGSTQLQIAASQVSAPFFSRFGAVETLTTPDGWGPGMHRVDMVLALTTPSQQPEGFA
jgi:GNAT superfamily N-acetyltransferase